jgi:polyamine oxidase
MVTFSPPLPDWKQESILKMPMSVYTKIFLKFPSKFWDDKEYILVAGRKKGYYPVFQVSLRILVS